MIIIKDNDDLEKFGAAVNGRLNEYFDGHLIVGFVAGQEMPVILSKVHSSKTCLGLESLLIDALAHLKTLRANGGC